MLLTTKTNMYTHKNKTQCLILKTGLIEFDKFVHPDGTVEYIRKQTNIKFGVFIPSKDKLDYYKALPKDTIIPHLRLSNVPVLLEEKSKDFPNGIPTGLFYVELDPKYVDTEEVVETKGKTK